MTERKIVIDTLQLNYQGLFNMNELYLIIDKWFREKGYDKYEKKNFEHVYKDGKQIEIEMEPWKKNTDYSKSIIKTNILVTNLKEVVIKKDKFTVKTNQGKILITFMGFLETDYEGRWESKAWVYFLRTLFDQYIYRIHTDKFEGYVAEDVNHLYNTIKAYLNLQKY
ncbi:hypothetical protein HZA96_02100 [Candidatus Woesearchaeota archaeon]|nr:hypothetical protein [Candidatus Woesearchaeota archaeon]